MSWKRSFGGRFYVPLTPWKPASVVAVMFWISEGNVQWINLDRGKASMNFFFSKSALAWTESSEGISISVISAYIDSSSETVNGNCTFTFGMLHASDEQLKRIPLYRSSVRLCTKGGSRACWHHASNLKWCHSYCWWLSMYGMQCCSIQSSWMFISVLLTNITKNTSSYFHFMEWVKKPMQIDEEMAPSVLWYEYLLRILRTGWDPH